MPEPAIPGNKILQRILNHQRIRFQNILPYLVLRRSTRQSAGLVRAGQLAKDDQRDDLIAVTLQCLESVLVAGRSPVEYLHLGLGRANPDAGAADAHQRLDQVFTQLRVCKLVRWDCPHNERGSEPLQKQIPFPESGVLEQEHPEQRPQQPFPAWQPGFALADDVKHLCRVIVN